MLPGDFGHGLKLENVATIELVVTMEDGRVERRVYTTDELVDVITNSLIKQWETIEALVKG